MPFQRIAIIYNPNSTGDAPANARKLAGGLRKSRPDSQAELLPTERAGHATELAYQFAKQHPKALIVAASGDGGYNEVINGALQAQEEGAEPVCAVLPSGNANDHARTMHGRPLLELIRAESVTHIDVLQLTAGGPDKTTRRYAHSYIGLGLTPKVGIDLNKHKLNPLVEAWLVFRALLRLEPTTIEVDGQNRRVDSLVCSTIAEMAKVLSLSSEADPRDGLFELTVLPHRNKLALFVSILKGAVTELGAAKQLRDYAFAVPNRTPVQCDGEILTLEAGSQIAVTLCSRFLKTIASQE